MWLGTSTVDCKTYFYNGTVASMPDGFGALTTSIPSIKDAFVLNAAVPYTPTNVRSRECSGPRARGLHGDEEDLGRPGEAAAAGAGLSGVAVRVQGVGAEPLRCRGHALHAGRQRSPIATARGLVENPVNLPIKYLCDAPQVLYLPGRPEDVKRNTPGS